jgi:hypothetical protein
MESTFLEGEVAMCEICSNLCDRKK